MRYMMGLLVLTAMLGVVAGAYGGYQRGFTAGQREMAAYVEDCELVDARAGKCVIPCGGDADCVAKNGSGDNY